MKFLYSTYYSTPLPKTPAAVSQGVRYFRSKRFHWPARERGVAPGRGNRAARRAYALEGSAVFHDSGTLGVSTRRLFIP